MTAIEAFVTRHPVRIYFALAFAVSWAGVLFVVGPGGIPTTVEHLMTIGPAMYVAMLAGPSVAGLLMTSLVSGRAGLREVLARLLKWRVGWRWYAVALLTAPFLVMTVSLALSVLSAEFLPAIFMTNDKAPLLLSGLAAGLIVGIFEELGWTGFAIPRMRRRYGVLSTRASRGGPVGSVALHHVLGTRQFFRSLPACPVARKTLLLAAGLPGADGVGLRPDREPARLRC